MSLEARVTALEETVAVLHDVLMALVGHDQALLAGLRAAITAKHPLQGSAALKKHLDESEAFLQGMPITDGALDQTAQAREKIAGAIHAAFLQASLSPGQRRSLKDKGTL